MSKYIDADKLKAEIERELSVHDIINLSDAQENGRAWHGGYRTALKAILDVIGYLQQENPKGIDGIVHHSLTFHWMVTDKNKMATILKAFPEGTEVELFICAKKKNDK